MWHFREGEKRASSEGALVSGECRPHGLVLPERAPGTNQIVIINGCWRYGRNWTTAGFIHPEKFCFASVSVWLCPLAGQSEQAVWKNDGVAERVGLENRILGKWIKPVTFLLDSNDMNEVASADKWGWRGWARM
ncbi:MAG: hypothetical protein ACREIM_07055 [Nitrospiraceae bacterium]